MQVQLCKFDGWSTRLSGTTNNPTATIQPYVMQVKIIDGMVCSASRGLSIGFLCKRSLNEIGTSVSKIYQEILFQTIQDNFVVNKVCKSNEDKGHCGNFRGNLNECRCGPLDRKTNPSLRRIYENRVINTINKLVHNVCFPINIAVFASGGLHGELVLMVRLIEHLKGIQFQGHINLFLIDKIYQESIRQACEFTIGPKPQTEFRWVNFIGGRTDLEQFLFEITLGLPSTITVGGELFGSDDDYILMTKCNQNYLCDIVIGADTETDGKIMGRIKREAQRIDIPGIALEKYNNIPQVCQINNNGITTPCDLIK